jgi:hypothetical protein
MYPITVNSFVSLLKLCSKSIFTIGRGGMPSGDIADIYVELLLY